MSESSVRVAELWMYPVKGCRGFPLRAGRLAPAGLQVDGIGDREWVVVDATTRRFLSQRELPRMALVGTRLTGECLRLKAPGMLLLEVPLASEGDVVDVTVWKDTLPAVTQGELADQWLSRFLERPVQLMRFDPEARRLSDRAYVGAVDAPCLFADAFSYLVTARASLDDLNGRLAERGGAAVTVERFRPNVVIEGLPAFEEDYARALRLPASAASLRMVKPCARCSVPGVDPETGEASTDVPDLLAAYRGRKVGGEDGVMFGVNAVPHYDAGVVEAAEAPVRRALATGAFALPDWPIVRVGDVVQVTLAFD